MSQHKHIGLLKTKMKSLINVHLEQITDHQEKEYFNFAIENYFKLAHYKDWTFNFIFITDQQSNDFNTQVSLKK